MLCSINSSSLSDLRSLTATPLLVSSTVSLHPNSSSSYNNQRLIPCSSLPSLNSSLSSSPPNSLLSNRSSNSSSLPNNSNNFLNSSSVVSNNNSNTICLRSINSSHHNISNNWDAAHLSLHNSFVCLFLHSSSMVSCHRSSSNRRCPRIVCNRLRFVPLFLRLSSTFDLQERLFTSRVQHRHCPVTSLSASCLRLPCLRQSIRCPALLHPVIPALLSRSHLHQLLLRLLHRDPVVEEVLCPVPWFRSLVDLVDSRLDCVVVVVADLILLTGILCSHWGGVCVPVAVAGGGWVSKVVLLLQALVYQIHQTVPMFPRQVTVVQCRLRHISPHCRHILFLR